MNLMNAIHAFWDRVARIAWEPLWQGWSAPETDILDDPPWRPAIDPADTEEPSVSRHRAA